MSFQGDETGPRVEVPLRSDEAEMSALGSMILSERAAEDLANRLRPEHFVRLAHRLIFVAMQALVAKARTIDQVTLEEELKAKGELASVGGPDYLIEVAMYVPSAANAAHYGDLLSEMLSRRELLKALEEAKQAALRGESLDALVETVRGIPARIVTEDERNAHVDIRKLLHQEATWKKAEVVSSGNPYLDALTEGGGLKCGQFSLSTAPTGEGKSTWANAVVFGALDRGERCATLSFTDLSREEIMSKAIRWLTGIAGTAFCETEAELRAVNEAKEHIFASWDWEIYDCNSSRGARYIEVAAAWLLRVQAEGLARKPDHRFPARPIRLTDWDYAQMIFTNQPALQKQTKYMQQMHVAQEFRLLTAQMKTAHAIMCAQLSDDKDREWIRDCKEWEFGAEFWFRIKKDRIAIKKRRFGGKTDNEPPHDHHPRRHTFVADGTQWDARFQP